MKEAMETPASLLLLRWILVAQAQTCAHHEITTDHLLMGLCVLPDAQPESNTELSSEHRAWFRARALALATDISALAQAFEQAGINRLRLHTDLRTQAFHAGIEHHLSAQGHVYHRDTQTRQCFAEAEAMTRPNPLFILAALLQKPSGNWPDVLAKHEAASCKMSLQSATKSMLKMLDVPHKENLP